jgi:hypothetical protein
VFSSIRVVKVDLIVKASKYVALVGFGDGRLGGKVLGLCLAEVRINVQKRGELPLDVPKPMAR